MKKITILKMALLVSVMSLANQSFTLVDSTTDNQLPSMREDWQNPQDIRCPYLGEMELDSDVDYQSNVKPKTSDEYLAGEPGNYENEFDSSADNVSTEYKDEQSDIEEMESGGDYVTGWAS